MMVDKRLELERKLFSTVNTGTLSAVQSLLGQGADANATDRTGRSALFTAVKRANAEVVKALVLHGADVNQVDEWGRTALFSAVEIGNDEVLDFLLQNGAKLDIKNDEGESPLFTAVKIDNVEYIAKLLEYGADAKVANNKGETALFKARSGEAMRTLCTLSYGVDVNAKDLMGRTALFYVSKYRHENIVPLSKVLLELGAKPEIKDKFGVTAMFYAARECFCHWEKDPISLELLKLLVHQQPNLKIFMQNLKDSQLISLICDDKAKLRFASFVLKAEEFHVYQEEGKAISFETNQPLKILDNCELLLEQGANPRASDEKGSSSLFSAIDRLARGEAVRNVIELCKLLIRYGADANARNAVCDSVLLHAIRHSSSPSIDLLKFLINGVCDITTRTPGGETTLHVLLDSYNRFSEIDCRRLVPELIDLLTSDRCYEIAKARDNSCNSALHIWAKKKVAGVASEHESVAKDIGCRIISGGAIVNAANDRAETPLHVAATWTAAEVLFANEALPNVRDVDGRTPLLSWVASDNFHSWNWKGILEAGMDPWMADHEGCTVFEVLLKKEKFKEACEFIRAVKKDNEKNVNKKHSTGDTLLHIACQCEAEQVQGVIQLLLECKADPRLENFCKETPLHFACKKVAKKENKDSIEAAVNSVHFWAVPHLLKHGAFPQARNGDGKSCEDIAQDIPQLQDLLEKEIDCLEISGPLLLREEQSEKHDTKLEQVRRKIKSRKVGTYHYHEEFIGEGVFSYVYVGLKENDGREVAIKRIESERIFRPQNPGQNRRQRRLEFQREIKHLVQLKDCDHVVRYLELLDVSDTGFVHIVFELLDGNLEEYMAAESLNADHRSLLCKDVVLGLNFLHQNNIIHRDIKPSNILYKMAKNTSRPILKIADFGLSKKLSSDAASRSTSMHRNAGTKCWMAPELLRATHPHSNQSDVFACGLVLHYILSDMRHPFEPADDPDSPLVIQNKTERNIYEGKSSIHEDLCPEANHLVKKMIEEDKCHRPETTEVLQHPFFWSSEKKKGFVRSVANQAEFTRPGLHPDSAVITELEGTLGTKFSNCSWDRRVSDIYVEMTSHRSYDTLSAVHLVRFVRNCYEHPPKDNLAVMKKLDDFVFFTEFPTLLMDVYSAIVKENWHQSRGEIRSSMVVD